MTTADKEYIAAMGLYLKGLSLSLEVLELDNKQEKENIAFSEKQIALNTEKIENTKVRYEQGKAVLNEYLKTCANDTKG